MYGYFYTDSVTHIEYYTMRSAGLIVDLENCEEAKATVTTLNDMEAEVSSLTPET